MAVKTMVTPEERVRLLRSLGHQISMAQRHEMIMDTRMTIFQVTLARRDDLYSGKVTVSDHEEQWVREFKMHECITSVMREAGIS